MTLRTRLALAAALVVAAVLAAASLTVYFTMRHELRAQVDGELAAQAATLQRHPGASFRGPEDFGGSFVEVIDTGGRIVGGSVDVLPVDTVAREIATGDRRAVYRDVTLSGYHLRELVAPLPDPLGAVLVVRSLHDVDAQLSRLRLILLVVSLGGVVVAALAGALVSRATLAPVRRLTAAAERIAETGKPSERVPAGGRGELARLGASFNTMLTALEESL